MFQRYGHSATLLRSSPHLLELLLFGGLDESFQCMSNTTVVVFGKSYIVIGESYIVIGE